MAYQDFITSPKGRLIDDILRSGLARMEGYSREGRPALLAVEREIARVAPELTDTEKQHVGRRVHQWIGPRGWRPAAKKRLPKGSLFTTAAVYEPSPTPDSPATGAVPAAEITPPSRPFPGDLAQRVAMAREILRRSTGGQSFTVDDFIREKRKEARREMEREERLHG